MTNFSLNTFFFFYFFFFIFLVLVLFVKFYSSTVYTSSGRLSYVGYFRDNLFFNILILNFFFFYLLMKSSKISLGLGLFFFFKWDSQFLLIATSAYVYFLLITNTKFGNYVFFFFINIFLVITISITNSSNFIDILVCLEFINMLIFLFLTLTLFFQPNTPSLIKSIPVSKNISYNSYFFFFNSLSTFFFFIFFLSIFFFLFFFLFYFYSFDSLLFFNIREFTYYSKNNLLILFLFLILAYKLGGAPVHLWKIEVFNNSKITNILFYSTVYLFFIFFIFYYLFLNLPLVFLSTKSYIFFFLISFNIFFVILNTHSVLTIKHFIVLSTLINSSFFFISILLFNEFRINFFFGFFLNYILSSFFLFLFFCSNPGGNSLISELSLLKNAYNNFFFFVIPLVTLSGTAPSLGFILKLLFLINSWALMHFWIFFIITFSIVITSIFYFQFFKNIFTPALRNRVLRPSVVLATNRFITLTSIVMLLFVAGFPIYSFYLYFENLYICAKVSY